MRNRNFRINGKLHVSVQYRQLTTQQSWKIIVRYRFFRFHRKTGFTSNNRLHWNTASLQQTPIWLSQKPLKCNYPLKNIWRNQNGYETKWAYNGCFYRLFKSFWYYDTIDFFTLIQKMHSLNFSTDFLFWAFNYLTHRQHFVQIDSNCSSLLTAKYRVQY